MIDLSQNLEKIVSDLVKIPSTTGNENKIFSEIRSSLNSLGLKKYHTINKNLVLELNKGRDDLALVSHIDTVSPSRDNHTFPTLKNGNLYGLGVADMKSGLACMLKLAYEYTKGLKLSKGITLVFYEGEEGPLPNGLTSLLDNGFLNSIDFAFVLEPTQNIYQIGCLGNITAEIKIKGKSAHSARPELGMNSIYLSQDIISKIRNFKDKKVSFGGYEFNETMNVTGVNTSNSHNMIPGETILILNYRFSPKFTLNQSRKKVISIVGDNIELKFLDLSPPCLVKGEIDQYLFKSIEKGITVGWTDIAQLNNARIPAINYGPGSLKVAHTAKERISIYELHKFYYSLKRHLI